MTAEGYDAARKVAQKLRYVTVDEIMGKGRQYRIATARQLTMWYLVRVLGLTFSDAGRALGRHHATIQYGVHQADIIIERNRSYDRDFHNAAIALKEEAENEA